MTAASLEAKLVASDERFAKVIIQLMGPMLEQGHLSYMHGGGWGYTWSETTVMSPDETLVNIGRGMVTIIGPLNWTGSWDSMHLHIGRGLGK